MLTASAIVVDALARGSKGRRVVTIDAIGAGPRTVAGVLEQLNLYVDLATAEDVLNNPSMLSGFDVLLVSGMSIDASTVSRVIKTWRRLRGDAAVLLGGPIAMEPWRLPELGADIAVIGEAEPVVERLFTSGALEGSKPDTSLLRNMCGVAYQEPGSGVKVNRRCPLMPRRVWERYRPSTQLITRYPLYWAARIYVEAVRGCSNYQIPKLEKIIPEELLPDKPRPGCAYCSVVTLWGYARSRSVDLVYQEVKELVEQGARRIVLSGPDFLDYGRDWLVEPRPLIDPRNPPPNVAALEALLKRITSIPEVASGEVGVMAENVKPSLVTEEAAEILGRYLRGTPVHIGVETGDERILEAMARPASVRESLKAVQRLVKHGLRVYAYIMYCLPGETHQSIEKTLSIMERLYRIGVEKITAYRFMPLPGSYLEKLASKPLRCTPNHPVKRKAEAINKRAKRRIVGERLRAIVAGIHPVKKKPVAYPLPHGPVLLLLDRAEPGEIVLAKVVGVEGDRMLRARIAKRLRRMVPDTSSAYRLFSGRAG